MGGAALAAFLLMQPVPVDLLGLDEEDFRFQTIERQRGEKDWPFVAGKGQLGCVMTLGQKSVFFIPDGRDDLNRAFLLDVNLLGMAIQNIGMKDVLAPYKTPEELIARIAPFVAQGRMLCDQKDSPVIVPGAEL
jgi:hypothetical protein